MHHCITNISITILVCLPSVACFAGPPDPVLLDDEPGLLIPLDGDPNDPSTWRFGAEQWGKNRHRSSGWVITDESPFSDAAVSCSGNVHPFNETVNCPSPVYRFEMTMKNIPGTKVPMDTERDWVLKFDVKVETVPGDTLGGDKLFEPQGATAGDIITITGASEELAAVGKRREAYSYFEGQANRYKVRYGPAPDGSDGITS